MSKNDEIPLDGPEDPNGSNEPQESSKGGDGVTRETESKTSKIANIAKDPKKAAIGMATDKAAQSIPGGEKAQETVKKVSEATQKVQVAVASAQAALSSAGSAFSGLVALLANPITWIIIAIVLVITLLTSSIIAGSHVIGRNENADGCVSVGPGSGGDGVPAEASPDQTATANSIAGWLTTTKFDFLGGKPMTVNQVAGIIGNWSQESALNPAIVQGNAVSPDASNAEIKALSGGGLAVGLAQWDSGRRTQLVEFAESKGGIWSDINIQLEFFKSELDGSEGANLIAGGFNDQSKSAEELTLIFMEKFERAGIPHMENRYAAAKAFLETYNGGYSGNTGGSCLTAKGNVNTSESTELAVLLSYPTSAESYVTPGDSYGRTKAKPEYKEAKAKAEQVGGKDPLGDLYASCDRFVATVVKLTMDPDIPWGSTSEQQAYLSSSPKWQQYTRKSEAQPGDVWVTRSNGHVIFYVGDYKGQDTIAHASYLDRVASLDPASYLNENLVDQGGRPYYGYHYIG